MTFEFSGNTASHSGPDTRYDKITHEMVIADLMKSLRSDAGIYGRYIHIFIEKVLWYSATYIKIPNVEIVAPQFDHEVPHVPGDIWLSQAAKIMSSKGGSITAISAARNVYYSPNPPAAPVTRTYFSSIILHVGIIIMFFGVS